jgi:hypothetical protein
MNGAKPTQPLIFTRLACKVYRRKLRNVGTLFYPTANPKVLELEKPAKKTVWKRMHGKGIEKRGT